MLLLRFTYRNYCLLKALIVNYNRTILYFRVRPMKKEVPPFGVLAADYDPEFHVIVRSGHTTSAKRGESARGKTAD